MIFKAIEFLNRRNNYLFRSCTPLSLTVFIKLNACQNLSYCKSSVYLPATYMNNDKIVATKSDKQKKKKEENFMPTQNA